jgi:hypothetical protein
MKTAKPYTAQMMELLSPETRAQLQALLDEDVRKPPSWDHIERRRNANICEPQRVPGISYPARTPGEARVQLRNLQHDHLHGSVPDSVWYMRQRRRLVRLVLGRKD